MQKKEGFTSELGVKKTLTSQTTFALMTNAGIAVTGPYSSYLETEEAIDKSIPLSHLIKDVPWHQQIDGLSCAAGALETVFHYWGADIDQKEIMNVARTSSSGTLSHDVVRTGQFSKLSDAYGSHFPSLGPKGGFLERPIGYAAFSRTSQDCWLDELKALVADNIPVIVLMSFEPTGGGGHYRVVIGYDDAQQLIFLCEPWGRDASHETEWTGVTSWSISDFQKAWDYSEAGVGQPYYGAVIIPWSVSISIDGELTAGSVLTITARISYPCPNPFEPSQFPAQESIARIVLPESMKVIYGSTEIIIGTIEAGKTIDVAWKVFCSSDPTGKCVSVNASGIVSGSVPEASWQGQLISYPSYDYSDMIGGEATVTII